MFILIFTYNNLLIFHPVISISIYIFYYNKMNFSLNLNLIKIINSNNPYLILQSFKFINAFVISIYHYMTILKKFTILLYYNIIL
mgnify:CR=1 FL=1